jgi:hypothetical protein
MFYRLIHFSRPESFPLEAAQISGIQYLMETDKEVVEAILNC